MTTTLPDRPAAPPSRFSDAFPNSTKVHIQGTRGIQVPMREIALSGGEPPLRVYDTSGPQGQDVNAGLPKLRDAWIAERDVERALPHPERSEGPCVGMARTVPRQGPSLRSG